MSRQSLFEPQEIHLGHISILVAFICVSLKKCNVHLLPDIMVLKFGGRMNKRLQGKRVPIIIRNLRIIYIHIIQTKHTYR